ncbi:lipid-A-disaccharide synthase [Spongorhabdus nitratireducens]
MPQMPVKEAKRPLVIGIVAGEASGDILGAGLIAAIRKQYPDASFTGIGGPLMIEQGFQSLVPMERLSVMGLVEVLGRIKELFGIRRRLVEHFAENRPDVFVGIDAPDFNLGLELRLKQQGIRTVHYVSPSVWAWRQGRVKKIRRACDHLLALLPFEIDFYKEHQVPVTFVGHPLADSLPLEDETAAARQKLELATEETIVGILPGSRGGEVKRLAPLFLETASQLVQHNPELRFLMPAANEQRYAQLAEMLKQYPDLPVKLLKGQSHDVMAASDTLLLASGTVALEAMLLKKPMVISYRLARLTYLIAKRLVKTKWYSLPNLLARKTLIPEIIQDDATPERLAEAIEHSLQNREERAELKERFLELHKLLKCNASQVAAETVLNLVDQTPLQSGPPEDNPQGGAGSAA